MKKIANKAKRQVKALQADETVNRSTKTRAVYKTKADAHDEIAKILAS
jgi:hypothetical protein